MVTIPSHFRITKVGDITHQNGVAFVLGKGIAAVGAIRDRLVLPDDFRLRIDRYDSVLSETGGVVPIYDCRAGEDREVACPQCIGPQVVPKGLCW